MRTNRIRQAARLTAGLVGAVAIAFWIASGSRLWLHAQSGCSSNPIVCENQLPGTPDTTWDISGAGDSTIQGFTTNISVNKGQTISFKVSAGGNYNVFIYRLGYYQGNGARLVATISNVAKQTQPACLTQVATGLVDCGNWAVSTSWAVPATAVSGIYIARLQRTDTGGASHVPFVVRDDTSNSDLIFQASDTTWQAYNSYGGNSFYLGSGPGVQGNAWKLSYNRPYNDRATSGGMGTTNWVFWAEYPMIRWLESNGYNVSYMAGSDTDRSGVSLPALPNGHKVFLSVGHDEYWAGTQRANVEAARDAGMHLAFFSGNEVYWKTRWENSIDGSNTPYRTLVCYKETWQNQVTDPQDPPTWTGTYRDPRFSPPADGGRPENAVSGTMFTVNRGPGGDLGTPFNVPAYQGKMRFWRNTSIANLAAGTTATIGDYELGYEWDSDLDNGFRPQGLIKLSSTTQSVPELLLDYGSTTGTGTATHNFTLYRAKSGAYVFGAGTVQYVWGLDGDHDGTGSAPQLSMQQATMNLLADMGVQPATMQSGLVPASASTDTTPPTSTITSPASGATIPATPITVSGTAADAGGGVVGSVEFSGDGGTTWHPATPGTNGFGTWSYVWRPGLQGPNTIMSRAIDDSGNIQPTPTNLTVNVTPATCPCNLWGSQTTPGTPSASDATPVEVGLRFYAEVTGSVTGVRFYKGSGNTGTHVGHLWTSAGALLATVTFTGESASGWQQANFSSPVAIAANTPYVISYYAPAGHYADDSGFFLLNGFDASPLHAYKDGVNGPNGAFVYATGGGFPTSGFNGTNYYVDVVFSNGADTTPPTVISVAPVNNATGVATTTAVSAAFSEPLTATTVTTSTFTLTGPGNTAVPATVGYNSTTMTATLTPTSGLAASTTYTALLVGGSSGIKDASGNALASNMTWSFTTGAATQPPSCPCSIWSGTTTPGTVDAGADSSVELGVKFQPNINGFVTGVRFYKASTNTGTHTGNLWGSGGGLLGSVTFTNETASGWQQANFATPIAVTANTVYVISYHTTLGHYSDDQNYFATSGVTNSPLSAPANGVSGSNGVFAYGSTSTFPSTGFNASNYWVDVVFNTTTTTAPTVTSVTPAGGATGIATNAAVTATFSQAMNAATITTTTFTLQSAGGPVSGTVSYNTTTNTATFTPSAALAASTTYTATVVGGTSGVANTGGTVMASNFTWSFTTVGAPTVTAVNPVNAATGVAVTTTVSAAFNQPMNAASITTTTFTLQSAGGPVTGTVSYNTTTNTATFTPSAALAPSTTYTATVVGGTGGVTNTGGVTMASSVTWSFTTAVPPTVTSVTPANAATGVATNATVTATFSQAMNAATITTTTFTLQSSGGPVTGTISYNSTTNTATFTPSGNLAATTTYTATVTTGVVSAAGVPMASSFSWSFTTGAAALTPIGIDVTAVRDTNGTMTTPAFSTKTSGDLLVAFVAYDGPQTSGAQTVTVSGAGLTWTLVARSNTQFGDSEIWSAKATGLLTNVTVTSTPSNTGFHGSLYVVAFTNASGVGAFATANASTGQPDIPLAAGANSWVWAVGNDWDGAVARTPVSGQVLQHQRVDTATGDTFWMQSTTAPSTTAGTVDIHDSTPTGDRWNFAAVEIKHQ